MKKGINGSTRVLIIKSAGNTLEEKGISETHRQLNAAYFEMERLTA
ncbi:hypothetical protein BpJC7_02650 [Weizmannia acidilactici]|uniref:Uncharacterized protein n=1 Tax=Weizmannia acidilactici TaxID=2607726 RepID=A0A5J4J1L7_9BACI|nr:hypothetical protein [Weizmannia acidilactici]GER65708.1 hypothetical protein BpJC4_01790 [Weizmannia acidilactici]GER68962.1 hypothetical protein BpJC7_02650 [Weizmannia acidilactici]GER72065.1 hypothetical protein BpPP18_01320 [Weizmannia acidilactici]